MVPDRPDVYVRCCFGAVERNRRPTTYFAVSAIAGDGLTVFGHLFEAMNGDGLPGGWRAHAQAMEQRLVGEDAEFCTASPWTFFEPPAPPKMSASPPGENAVGMRGLCWSPRGRVKWPRILRAEV